MIISLFKIINNIIQGSISPFERDIIEDENFLRNLEQPKDFISLSFNQYRCQRFQSSKIWHYGFYPFLYIGILVLMILYIIRYNKNRKSEHNNIALILDIGIKDLVPEIELQRHENALHVPYNGFGYLNMRDLAYITSILPYFFHPIFFIKVIYRIAYYRLLINRYGPSSIITSSEFSYTSSVLTEYCGKEKVEHINVMHGEKLFNIRDSFFSFHKAYIWHSHYLNLFNRLRVPLSQFVISKPPLFFKRLNQYELGHITYYLADENEDDMNKVKNTLDRIRNSFSSVSIRPHPKWSDISVVREVFVNYSIESPYEFDIMSSLEKAEYVTSLYSTVLFQGLILGRKVVMDDLSRPERFLHLRDLDYHMLECEHLKLSEFLSI